MYMADYSTGDEWEKDFELEINDLKNQALQGESQKEVSSFFLFFINFHTCNLVSIDMTHLFSTQQNIHFSFIKITRFP